MKKLSVYISEFIDLAQSTKNLSSKTTTAYKSDLNDFAKYVDCKPIDKDTIIVYIQTLSQKRKLKDSTINRKLIVLKMFFQFLHSHNYIETNYYSVHSFKFKKNENSPKP